MTRFSQCLGGVSIAWAITIAIGCSDPLEQRHAARQAISDTAPDTGTPPPQQHPASSNGVASVISFGAKADGETDDTAAIQRALDSGAKVVEFPVGTYRISAPLVPAARQTVRGAGGREASTLHGVDIAGGLIQPNPDYDSPLKRGLTIENLRFTGTRIDYGVFAPRCQSLHLRNLRFVFGSTLRKDVVHVGESWDSKIENIHIYSDSGRASLWLDSAVHGLHVSDIHTAAKTRYGVMLTVEDAKLKETSASVVFNQLVLQRHEVGLWIKSARAVTVNGLYTEATQVAVRLGGTEDIRHRASAVVINGGRQGALISKSKYWPDNTTGVIEAIKCKGVTINGFRFDAIHGGSDYNALYIKDAQALALNNCVANNAQLYDWSRAIVLAPDAEADNTISIVGNGRQGREMIMSETFDPARPNKHWKLAISNGRWAMTGWTPKVVR